MIAPFFLMLAIGGIDLSIMGFTQASLHYAVEAGARCASITTATCTSTTTTATYAASKFTNVTGNSPSFVLAAATCGNRVTGTITYRVEAGITSFTVPLSAVACFP